MRLFQMDEQTFELSIDPEVLTIKEFAQIIKRDKSKGKSVAMAELAYIWFFCDFKSDFVQIINEEDRSNEIILSLSSLDDKWIPDSIVKDAIERYKNLSKSVTVRMLQDARTIIDNMSKYAKMASENLDEIVETKFGEKQKYDIARVQSFITNLPKMLETINSLEEKVLREKDNKDSHRGSQEKAIFEDEN